MITNGKQLTDMAANTAVMVCFAVKKLGPEAAAVVSGLQLLFDVFYPSAQYDWRAAGVTNQGLQESLQHVTEQIVEAAWQLQNDKQRDEVIAAHRIFLDTYWEGLKDLTIDGKTWTIQGGDSNFKFIGECDTYFDPGSAVLGRLQATIVSLTLDSLNDKLQGAHQVLGHTTKTTGLLCLTGSFLAAWLKTQVLWYWASENEKWYGYEAYRRAMKIWNSKNQAYRDARVPPVDPLVPPEKHAPNAPVWGIWANDAGSPVRVAIETLTWLIDYAQGAPAGVDPKTHVAKPAVKGLLTSMTEHFANRAEKVKNRVAKLSIQTYGLSGKNFCCVDAETGEMSPPVLDRRLAELHMDAKRGQIIAYEWDRWSQAYGIDGVSQDELNGFRDNVDLWKQVRASIDFDTHPVAAGDTLASIALQHYKNADLAIYIYNFNGDTMFDVNVLPPEGTFLRIPNIAKYTVVAGDTLAIIAARPYVYNDATQATILFNANKDILKTPASVVPGQMLRIPNLPPKVTAEQAQR